MIRVEKQPEPRPPGFDFDNRVRQPGLSALAELTGQPQTLTRPGRPIRQRATRVEDLKHDDLRDYAYWTRALDAMHEAYRGICAYSCFYMEPLCGLTVDHFVALSRTEAAQAYEWDNYRLACSLMNAAKNQFPDVLDPFLIQDGWFTLNLATFQVEAAEGLEEPLKQQVQATITRLKLASREISNTHRSWFETYWKPAVPSQPIPLWFLEQRAPFLVREMRRQGRIRPEDAASLR
ncbi:hypothetical protein EJ065_7668 [Corallococcus coralloides]|uniref:HNH nuclease domain-containing protein n=1 Tax=Corallococcus coralloides TaxID=184914 RepID=A0A410S4X3_CORCK|nr:hypothetical protein [Corallococcus coralloides]QAT89183.1 hypothetical protein EJ065_7668 [Corallococcus coralloides]